MAQDESTFLTQPSVDARAIRRAADGDAWQRLLRVDQRSTDDRQFLVRLLAGWLHDCGLEGAALYYAVDDGFRLHAQAGQGSFPDRYEPDEVESSELLPLELPYARLLVRCRDGAPAPSAEDPELLLLALGSRVSRFKEHIQEQSFQANFRGVELEALYDVGLAVTSTLDLDALAEAVLMHAVSLLDARRGALFLLEDGSYRQVRSIGGGAREQFTADAEQLQRLLTGEGEEAEDLLPGARYLQVAAIEFERQPRGLLVVADKESRRGVGPFPTKDQRTLALFANQAAIALENAKLHRLALEKERLEREMELAAEIQQQILPRSLAEVPGFEVLGWNRPARHVGGDYYNLWSIGEGRWAVVLGDVTGKGVPASLLVSTFHSALRLLGDRMEVGPELMARLNQHIHESTGRNKFITGLVAELRSDDRQLTYLNAGHNPGVLVRANGESEQLPAAGLPLGLLPGGTYRAEDLELEDGDLLCIYSDGITECESPDEDEFGLERLIELLTEHRQGPLQDVVGAIDEAVVSFAADRPQGDDQTVLLIRCGSLPAA